MSERRKQIVTGLIVTLLGASIIAVATATWRLISDGTLVTIFRSDVPAGAVVAFDDPSGCPEDNWSAFSDGEGKFIVGVGTGYEYRSTGGQSEVALEENHVPPHDHSVGAPVWGVGVDSDGDESRLPTLDAGYGVPSPSLTAVLLSYCRISSLRRQECSSGTTNARKSGNGSVRWSSCGRLPAAGRRRARRRWPAVRFRPAWRCARAACARRGAGRWR